MKLKNFYSYIALSGMQQLRTTVEIEGLQRAGILWGVVSNRHRRIRYMNPPEGLMKSVNAGFAGWIRGNCAAVIYFI